MTRLGCFFLLLTFFNANAASPTLIANQGWPVRAVQKQRALIYIGEAYKPNIKSGTLYSYEFASGKSTKINDDVFIDSNFHESAPIFPAGVDDAYLIYFNNAVWGAGFGASDKTFGDLYLWDHKSQTNLLLSSKVCMLGEDWMENEIGDLRFSADRNKVAFVHYDSATDSCNDVNVYDLVSKKKSRVGGKGYFDFDAKAEHLSFLGIDDSLRLFNTKFETSAVLGKNFGTRKAGAQFIDSSRFAFLNNSSAFSGDLTTIDLSTMKSTAIDTSVKAFASLRSGDLVFSKAKMSAAGMELRHVDAKGTNTLIDQDPNVINFTLGNLSNSIIYNSKFNSNKGGLYLWSPSVKDLISKDTVFNTAAFSTDDQRVFYFKKPGAFNEAELWAFDVATKSNLKIADRALGPVRDSDPHLFYYVLNRTLGKYAETVDLWTYDFSSGNKTKLAANLPWGPYLYSHFENKVLAFRSNYDSKKMLGDLQVFDLATSSTLPKLIEKDVMRSIVLYEDQVVYTKGSTSELYFATN